VTLYRFIGLVLLLMIPFFGLWYALGALPSAPALWLAQVALPWALPEVVQSVVIDGDELMVFTLFGEVGQQVVPLNQAEYQLAFPSNTRILSYSIPFYAALHFASHLDGSIERFARGLLLLWLLMFIGVIAVTLKNLMLGLGDLLWTASTNPLPSANAIALLFQFSTLIVPTVAPIMLWAWSVRESPHWRAILLGEAAARRQG
jgi:hypothetical protein|tara:strand:+ start:12485 stop:13093 length:609 start_codon:yes stop_codon:yes gene_type:complete